MIVLAVSLAVSAVGWMCLPRQGLARLEASQGQLRSGSGRWRWLATLPALLGVILLGLIMAGHRGAVVCAVLAVAGSVAVYLLMTRRRQRLGRRRRGEIAQACAALASLVAAGRVPAEALRDVAGDWEVLAEGATTASLGGDPAGVWLRESSRPGCHGLAELARGWRVSERSGAPLTGVLDTVAGSLRSDADIRLTVEAELASSRATGRLLAALPLMGLLLGFGFGGDPVAFLLDRPVGWACCLSATVLAAAGVLWTERIADRAEAW